MKNYTKKALSLLLTASMLLGTVITSYANALYDDTTGRVHTGIRSDSKASGNYRYTYMDGFGGTIGQVTRLCSILEPDDMLWVEYQRPEYGGVDSIDFSYIKYFSSEILYEDTDYKVAELDKSKLVGYDTKFNLYDYVVTNYPYIPSMEDLQLTPHMFCIEFYGKDGSIVNSAFSYYKDFKDMLTEEVTWRIDNFGKRLERADGSYLINQWFKFPDSDLYYYAGADGYILTNTVTPDGFTVDENGVWVQYLSY